MFNTKSGHGRATYKTIQTLRQTSSERNHLATRSLGVLIGDLKMSVASHIPNVSTHAPRCASVWSLQFHRNDSMAQRAHRLGRNRRHSASCIHSLFHSRSWGSSQTGSILCILESNSYLKFRRCAHPLRLPHHLHRAGNPNDNHNTRNFYYCLKKFILPIKMTPFEPRAYQQAILETAKRG